MILGTDLIARVSHFKRKINKIRKPVGVIFTQTVKREEKNRMSTRCTNKIPYDNTKYILETPSSFSPRFFVYY